MCKCDCMCKSVHACAYMYVCVLKDSYVLGVYISALYSTCSIIQFRYNCI